MIPAGAPQGGAGKGALGGGAGGPRPTTGSPKSTVNIGPIADILGLRECRFIDICLAKPLSIDGTGVLGNGADGGVVDRSISDGGCLVL